MSSRVSLESCTLWQAPGVLLVSSRLHEQTWLAGLSSSSPQALPVAVRGAAASAQLPSMLEPTGGWPLLWVPLGAYEWVPAGLS